MVPRRVAPAFRTRPGVSAGSVSGRHEFSAHRIGHVLPDRQEGDLEQGVATLSESPPLCRSSRFVLAMASLPEAPNRGRFCLRSLHGRIYECFNLPKYSWLTIP